MQQECEKGGAKNFSVNKIIPSEEKYKLKIFFYLTMLDMKNKIYSKLR